MALAFINRLQEPSRIMTINAFQKGKQQGFKLG
jgi:hypothetical protein